MKFLVVALGNPGDKYQNTRHNAGWRAIDAFREKNQYPEWQKFKHGFLGLKRVNGLWCKKDNVILFKPLTFMNLSGSAILKIKNYLKIDTENIIILLDDINFDIGLVKAREKGSAGGHNGMKSIITCLKTQEIKRIKIGVGKFKNHPDLAGYVLAKLNKDELDNEEKCYEMVFEKIKSFTRK